MAEVGPLAYSVPKLAAAWGVSTRHVYALCARGELGHLRIGNLIRIRQADREAYEARQWHAPS
jgi:excisionase family DNA binding protein